MPGQEIKGRSKIANYRHGGRAGFRGGKKVISPKTILRNKKSKEIFKKARGKK
jgi:hypothetical protein